MSNHRLDQIIGNYDQHCKYYLLVTYINILYLKPNLTKYIEDYCICFLNGYHTIKLNTTYIYILYI